MTNLSQEESINHRLFACLFTIMFMLYQRLKHHSGPHTLIKFMGWVGSGYLGHLDRLFKFLL